jgi:hypothetical protein
MNTGIVEKLGFLRGPCRYVINKGASELFGGIERAVSSGFPSFTPGLDWI